MSDQDRQQSFKDRYASGEIPWDDQLPPPEVLDLAEQLIPGRALDLGSGYGRTAIYLAGKGWHVDGIEFVERAVREARRRAHLSGMEHLTHFHMADVTKLDFLSGPYDLAIDIGCMHTLELPDLTRYRDGLKRLLRGGALYLLFAHLRNPEDDSEDAEKWIEESVLRALFYDGFSLNQVVHGITKVPDRPPWLSAWFTFQRL